MPYFIYILRNPQGRFYVGQTSDLTLRLRRHNRGLVTWTKSRGPWQLVHSEEFQTRSAAMKQERRLKNLKSNKAIEDYVARP